MNFRTVLIICLMGVFIMTAHRPAEAWSKHNTSAHDSATQHFVHTASISNQFEIESSRLALDKSHNDGVRHFAQRMIDDHTKAGNQMKQALQYSDSGAKMATSLDNKHQKLLDELQNAGASFDRDYIKIQTEAHKNAVSLFSDYSKHGKNPAIKQFAAQTLPTLKEHLNMVEHLSAAK